MTSVRSGMPVWLSDAPPSDLGKPLAGDARCEVLVIGAGISGSMIAAELARRGVETVVVDRHIPAAGSTAACTALIQYELDLPLTRIASIHDEAHALDRLAGECAELGVRCVERPSLLVAKKARDVRAMRHEVDARRAAGIDVDLVDSAALRAEWNVDRPAAIASRRSLELDPYALSKAMLAAAVRRGARLHVPTEVRWESIDAVGGETPRICQTAHGPRIVADRVVIAGGYQTPASLRSYAGTLLSTYAAATKPIRDLERYWPRRQFVWEWGSAYLYARTTPEDRLIFGGGDRRFRSPAIRDMLLKRTIKALAGQIAALSPGIEFEVEFEWAGTFGETSDGMPVIGPLKERPGLILAAGFGGNGVTFSTIAAQAIADLVTDPDRAAEMIHLFGPDRRAFRRLI
jgi:glycine/D-amino acid oxidase-like deaminating enzyme